MVSEKQKWMVVAIYAIAMAWVESAVVVYLRTMIDRIVPYQPDPLPIFVGVGWIELGREAATLVMLLTIGWVAGRTWSSRFAYAAIAFGVWDIFYYIFLVPMSGWPQSLFDWDILFLLPLPWWGPVIAPVLISMLMIIGGTLITQFGEPRTHRFLWTIGALGCLLALYTFMADAIRVADNGAEIIRTTLPGPFNWVAFILAFVLMSTPIVELARQIFAPSAPMFKQNAHSSNT
jgi:hypothetical protein